MCACACVCVCERGLVDVACSLFATSFGILYANGVLIVSFRPALSHPLRRWRNYAGGVQAVASRSKCARGPEMTATAERRRRRYNSGSGDNDDNGGVHNDDATLTLRHL